MEKRRVRLVINGVVCGVITEESDEYMLSVSKRVEGLIRKISAASPVITKEAAAVTAALSFCDEAEKNEQLYFDMRKRAKTAEKKAAEAERKLAEIKRENSQLWEETDALLSQPGDLSGTERSKYEKRIKELEAENEVLRIRKNVPEKNEKTEREKNPGFKNPLRKSEEYGQQGFISFFERDGEEVEENTED